MSSGLLDRAPLPVQQHRSKATLVIAAAAVIALLYFGRVLLITLVCSVILAFLLEPPTALLVRLRLRRGLASFLVCGVGILAVYLAGLGVYLQMQEFMQDLPAYSQRINELVDRVATQLESLEKSAYQLVVPKRLRDREAAEPQPPLPPAQQKGLRRRSAEPVMPVVPEIRIRQERASVLQYIYPYLRGFYDVLLMLSFVPFLVYFMLSWRDHITRTFLQLFSGEGRRIASAAMEGVADVARAYVVGNFILGVLLSVSSALFFAAVDLPYWLVVGPLSGLLSLVPYIGLPLAMLPPFFVALPAYQGLTPYLILGSVVAFFHLIAQNLLYPKVVGARVGLNPLVVTIALMFWATVWGAVGLALAIPITAGIKAVCDNVEELRPYGRVLGD